MLPIRDGVEALVLIHLIYIIGQKTNIQVVSFKLMIRQQPTNIMLLGNNFI